jgi:hypothetical protein
MPPARGAAQQNPSAPLAPSLAVMEAVVGQILLVVMMARLIGLHVAQGNS